MTDPDPRWACALGNPFCCALTSRPRLNGDNRHAQCWRDNTATRTEPPVPSPMRAENER